MNVHYLSGARTTVAGAAQDAVGRRQLEAVAEQFEAMFLRQLLKQMRKAGDVLGADSPMRSRTLDTMRELQDEAMADELAVGRQTGIADMIVRQLTGEGPARAPALAVPVSLVSRMQASVVQPLAAAWRRGGDGAARIWEQGSTVLRAMVDSVIAHESGGRHDAVSPRGAQGLMQLMPETAREVAEELGLEYDERRLLADGAYNKQLGTAYLRKMLDRYDGVGALALAAYNAGPGRVDDWLQRFGDPRSGGIRTGDWVERIPFKETREYTRSIIDSIHRQGLSVSDTGVESEAALSAQAVFSSNRLKAGLHMVAINKQVNESGLMAPRAAGGSPQSPAFAQSVRVASEDLKQ